MKIILIVALCLCSAVLLALVGLYFAGSTMPREHRSQVTATYPADRAAVWNAITDYEAMPGWWAAVKSVRSELLLDGTLITWNKDAHGNEVPFKTTEMLPNLRLVRTIVATGQPFGGKWTFELADAPTGGTRLTITEDGWIDPPFYRAVARWFIGLDARQRDFLASLGRHLADKPQ